MTGLSSNFLMLLTSAKRVKFAEEGFSQKNVFKWAKYVHHYKSKLKRQPMERKHTHSMVKKRFGIQQSVKKVMLTDLLGHERIH